MGLPVASSRRRSLHCPTKVRVTVAAFCAATLFELAASSRPNHARRITPFEGHPHQGFIRIDGGPLDFEDQSDDHQQQPEGHQEQSDSGIPADKGQRPQPPTEQSAALALGQQKSELGNAQATRSAEQQQQTHQQQYQQLQQEEQQQQQQLHLQTQQALIEGDATSQPHKEQEQQHQRQQMQEQTQVGASAATLPSMSLFEGSSAKASASASLGGGEGSSNSSSNSNNNASSSSSSNSSSHSRENQHTTSSHTHAYPALENHSSSGFVDSASGNLSALGEVEERVEAAPAESDQIKDITEKELSRVLGALLMAMLFVVSGVLYLLNYPDPQIQNYTVKLISLAFSIFAAVLLEKLQLNYSRETVLMPYIQDHCGPEDSRTCAIASFSASFCIWLFWFWVISYACFKIRHHPVNSVAIKSFLGHETAFVGIFVFGLFQKWVAEENWGDDKKNDVIETIAYLGAPAVIMLLCKVIQCILKPYRRWLGSSLPPEEQGGEAEESEGEESVMAEHHHWEHYVIEAENDAVALTTSFLIRQAVLYYITGRIPSMKGDYAHHSWAQFGMLGLAIVVVLLLIFATQKARVAHRGEEGLLEQSLHFDQELGCMVLGWFVLCLVQWVVQELFQHKATWQIAAACMATPVSCGLLVLADWLVDRRLLNEDFGSAAINLSGFILGFAWEVAFAASIDTISQSKERGITESFDILYCIALLLVIVPAWRYYLLPRAMVPAPPRDFSWLDKPEKPEDLPTESLAGAEMDNEAPGQPHGNSNEMPEATSQQPANSSKPAPKEDKNITVAQHEGAGTTLPEVVMKPPAATAEPAAQGGPGGPATSAAPGAPIVAAGAAPTASTATTAAPTPAPPPSSEGLDKPTGPTLQRQRTRELDQVTPGDQVGGSTT